MSPIPIEAATSFYFWGFLLAYGAVMYAVSPRSRSASGFFAGTDDAGRPATEWALMCSIFVSWIFAKSVTNAANLGAAHGVVGGLAYATYWLSIPVAGFVIYRLRTRYGATGLVPFLIGRYGRLGCTRGRKDCLPVTTCRAQWRSLSARCLSC
jgi:solute:Na+ symporter, SSS family